MQTAQTIPGPIKIPLAPPAGTGEIAVRAEHAARLARSVALHDIACGLTTKALSTYSAGCSPGFTTHSIVRIVMVGWVFSRATDLLAATEAERRQLDALAITMGRRLRKVDYPSTDDVLEVLNAVELDHRKRYATARGLVPDDDPILEPTKFCFSPEEAGR